MARNKTLLMKEIRSDLDSCSHILGSLDDKPTYQEIMAAASIANQAAMRLYRMAGMLDVESASPR